MEDAREIARIVRENTKPEMVAVDSSTSEKVNVMLVPDGMSAKSTKSFFDELKEKPDRRQGTISIKRVSSFIDIVNRFKNENSVIFAKAQVSETSLAAHVKAIFDYHPEGGDVSQAENLGHKAEYKFPTTHEFEKWLSLNNKGLDQEEFAYFLEKNVNALVEPEENDKLFVSKLGAKFADPIDILELSRELEIYSRESLVQKHKTSSGERELKFTTEHTDASGTPLSIPDCFVIRVPIFEGGAPIRIVCQLRYRKREGKVTWYYEMYEVSTMLEQAFEASCEKIKEAVELPLFYGESE